MGEAGGVSFISISILACFTGRARRWRIEGLKDLDRNPSGCHEEGFEEKQCSHSAGGEGVQEGKRLKRAEV
jgi:hypothetical protein